MYLTLAKLFKLNTSEKQCLRTCNCHQNKNGKVDVWRERAQGEGLSSCRGFMPQIAMHRGPLPSMCMHAWFGAVWTHTPTRTHAHTCTHTLSFALFVKHSVDGGWFCNIQYLSYKRCLTAYHWLQTYCLHRHINLIQKLSKGPLVFIHISAATFYFGKERSSKPRISTNSYWLLKKGNIDNKPHHLCGTNDIYPFPKEKVKQRLMGINLKWWLSFLDSNHPHS